MIPDATDVPNPATESIARQAVEDVSDDASMTGAARRFYEGVKALPRSVGAMDRFDLASSGRTVLVAGRTLEISIGRGLPKEILAAGRQAFDRAVNAYRHTLSRFPAPGEALEDLPGRLAAGIERARTIAGSSGRAAEPIPGRPGPPPVPGPCAAAGPVRSHGSRGKAQGVGDAAGAGRGSGAA